MFELYAYTTDRFPVVFSSQYNHFHVEPAYGAKPTRLTVNDLARAISYLNKILGDGIHSFEVIPC